jgi:hypothetical protein
MHQAPPRSALTTRYVFIEIILYSVFSVSQIETVKPNSDLLAQIDRFMAEANSRGQLAMLPREAQAAAQGAATLPPSAAPVTAAVGIPPPTNTDK